MVLYFYMVVQLIFSFVLVGIYFAAFVEFTNSNYKEESTNSTTFEDEQPSSRIPNLIIYAFAVFLLFTLILSTTVEIQWAETGFRA